ncbi:hypothetical protein CD107_10870 [Mammaliicoccus vitulinus]|nr:hypothetical protein CD107_10870 [Mammaliicoccus vitulinus]
MVALRATIFYIFSFVLLSTCSICCKTHQTSNIGDPNVLKSYDFESACLPRGMARACSLSLILFPRASALCKIVENILKIFCYLS